VTRKIIKIFLEEEFFDCTTIEELFGTTI